MNFPIRAALRSAAVPPGRIPYDIGAPVLLLHTIQTEDAFDELMSTGRLLPDPRRAEPEFVDAYAWMLRQMNRRLPTRGTGALWLLARQQRRDLMSCCRLARGEVLLTCRIPRNRVLLSHFSDWHQVLNVSPNVIPLPGESDAAYGNRLDVVLDELGSRLDARGVDHRAPSTWPDDLRTEIEASWESIFEPSNYGRTDYWQATVHELRTEDVTYAVRLE